MLTEDERQFITCTEAAHALGYTVRHIPNLIQAGRLRGGRWAVGEAAPRWYADRDDVARLARGEPVSRDLAYRWLKKAERKAGLEPIPRAWHNYRAKFATEMVGQPVQVTAALGGWKTPRVITDIYQQPQGTQLEDALRERKTLREA